MYAAHRKESTAEQGKIRRFVNPRLRYQKRILPTVPDMDHLCGSACTYKEHVMLRKARKHKSGGSKPLERWHDDDKYRKSMSDVGCAEEQISQYDEIALEDHSYVATQQERSRNEKSWKLSLNAEGIQGPLSQRSDFVEAKQTCKRLYHEFSAITGDGNKPIPPEQQVRQRLGSTI